MLEIMQYRKVKKYKRYFTTDLNTRSILYFDKDLLHKIPFKVSDNSETVLKYVYKLKSEELVEIKRLIYKNNLLVGYSIKNYKEYKSLKKLRHRKFKAKKNDCFKIVQTFNRLSHKNLSYSDFHLGNVLLNPQNDDIKVCDIDSFSIKDNKELDKDELQKLLILILAYLYNINEFNIRNVIYSSGIDIPDSFINYCCISKRDITLEKIYEIINKMRYNYIEEEKKYIIKKSKQLSDLGYNKYARY